MENNDGDAVSQNYGDEIIGKWNSRSKRHIKKKIMLSYLLKVICASKETCIDWLKNRGFIPRIMFCPNCSHKMKFEINDFCIDGYIWTCKECTIDSPQFSARHGSWLEGREDPLLNILLFTYLWAHGFSEPQISKETNMPLNIVKEWNDSFLNICESVCQRKVEEDHGNENVHGISNKESCAMMWRRKNKYKDPFLEFLKDADSI